MDVHEPKVIEEWKNKVNPELTCFIKLNRGQRSSENEIMINLIQSLARVTVYDEVLKRHRNLSADIGKQDITIQPTSAETIWIVHAQSSDIINQLVNQGSVAYFKRGSVNKKEKPIQVGLIQIKSFKHAVVSYRIRGATCDANLHRYSAELKKVFQKKCPKASVAVEPQRKRVQIWDFHNEDIMEQEVYSGDIIVRLASNSWTQESAEEFCGPFKMRVVLRSGERPTEVTMHCEPMGGPPRCRICEGTDCAKFTCKKKCPHCLVDLAY